MCAHGHSPTRAYQFPIADVISSHQFSRLKQYPLLIPQFPWVRSPGRSFSLAGSLLGVSQDEISVSAGLYSLLETLGCVRFQGHLDEVPFPCWLKVEGGPQVLGAPWLLAPFPHLQSQQGGGSPSPAPTICAHPLCSFPAFKGSHDCTGPTRIIPDALPIVKSAG